MKLIIDIPEVVKHQVYAHGLSLSPSDKEQLIKAIMNGIPLEEYLQALKDCGFLLHSVDVLDKIRAEIESQLCGNGMFNDGIDKAITIIDKYRGESE